MPIRHQSGRSDISSDRGHTSPGSYPSTMEAPPSNQDGLHRIQVIQRTQEVFGRTLRAGLTLSEAEDFDETGDFRSPFLSAIPVVNVLARLIFCDAVTLLYFALQLVPMAVDHVKIIVGELAPLLFDLAFHLFPISFDA